MSVFPDRLTQERKNIGFSQERLSEILEISRDTLSKWENGHRFPDIEQLQKICKIFNCDADYMLGNIEERSHDIRKMMNKTGLSDSTIQLLEDLNVDISPQVSRILDFIVQYRLHCRESNIREDDLIDGLNSFFVHRNNRLQYFSNTGRISDDELHHIFADDLFFDDAALLHINNILKDMKKEWNKRKSE